MSELAIHGGAPVRDTPFPAWPVWGEPEEQALLETLHSGQWGWSDREDSRVARFEAAFARSHHAEYGRCVFNGTVALEVALRALDIGYGDEVIVPPYTFIATATACLSVGALPVFVDIDPDTYTIAPDQIEAAITPRTRAIIPVHIGGCPSDMDAILQLAHRHDLHVIEDACQAHAAAWNGRRVGSLGDLGCFSFQSSKNINAGEGGIVITRNEGLAELCWSVRNCGRVRDGAWYQHERLGSNFRMTEWQGAILLVQVERMEELAARRERSGDYLGDQLSEIAGIAPQRRDARVTQHGYHLFIMRYDAEAFDGLPRERFLDALRAEGIPCSPGYVPLYRERAIQTATSRLRRFVDGAETAYELPDCPATERACAEEGIWLTQNILLGAERDMDDIVEAIAKIKAHAGELATA